MPVIRWPERGYDVLDEDRAYFDELREKGISLSQEQMVWYSHMKQTQGELMKQEYPSTPEEALWPHVSGGDLWCRDAQVAGAGVRGGGVCRGAGVSVSFRMGFRVER